MVLQVTDKITGLSRPDDIDAKYLNGNMRDGVKTVINRGMGIDRPEEEPLEGSSGPYRGSREIYRRETDTKPYTDLKIEKMWWKRMLRSPSWTFRIRVDIPDTMTSQSYYENRTPIRITQ